MNASRISKIRCVNFQRPQTICVLVMEVSQFWASTHKVHKCHNTEAMWLREKKMCRDGIMEMSLTVRAGGYNQSSQQLESTGP